MQAAAPVPPPPFSPGPSLPPPPKRSGAGGPLRILWRVLVMLQAAAGGAALALGLVFVEAFSESADAGSSGEAGWSRLFEAVGWIVAVIGGIVLVWSLAMFAVSFISNFAAAMMGLIQGLLWLGSVVTGAVDAGISEVGAFIGPLAIAVAWIGLCATYRTWPDGPQPRPAMPAHYQPSTSPTHYQPVPPTRPPMHPPQ